MNEALNSPLDSAPSFSILLPQSFAAAAANDTPSSRNSRVAVARKTPNEKRERASASERLLPSFSADSLGRLLPLCKFALSQTAVAVAAAAPSLLLYQISWRRKEKEEDGETLECNRGGGERAKAKEGGS